MKGNHAPKSKTFDPYDINIGDRTKDETVEEYLRNLGVPCIVDLNDEETYEAGIYYRIKPPKDGEKVIRERVDENSVIFLPDFQEFLIDAQQEDSTSRSNIEIYIIDQVSDETVSLPVVIYKQVDIPALLEEHKSPLGYGKLVNIVDIVPVIIERDVGIIRAPHESAQSKDKEDGVEVDDSTFFKTFKEVASKITLTGGRDFLKSPNTPIKSPESTLAEGLECIVEQKFKEEFNFAFDLIKEADLILKIQNVLFDFSELLDWQISGKRRK
ncbi:MAG: hypothetical protein HWN65_09960 [Candidatus Helarchaeota archaeon]|nr:hypothetical protein [Candidatus Helarchaeota archaeon]